jgi:hypothetical protein
MDKTLQGLIIFMIDEGSEKEADRKSLVNIEINKEMEHDV